MSAAGQTLGQPISRTGMTFQPAHNMRDVVQKPERHRDPAVRGDAARRPHQTMSGCVNVTAGDGNCCHAGGLAGTMLRQDMDRIDAVMTMRSARSRLRPSPQQAACHGKHRSGKTGIASGLHLDLVFSGNRRMMASLKLRLPLSTDFGNANSATRASKGEGRKSVIQPLKIPKFRAILFAQRQPDVCGPARNSAPIVPKCFT
jgi:hypothetical protein